MTGRFNEAFTPQGQALNAWAADKINASLYRTGRALPCQVVKVQGQFVTVSFQVQSPSGQTAVTLPNVTIPIATWVYVRIPVQIGDLGLTIPADVNLSGINGQGNPGPVPFVKSANLTGLAFLPVANTSWDAAVDPNAVQVAGPNGVVLMVAGDPTNAIKVNSDGITLTGGGVTMTINSSGITLDGILWETHDHTYAPGSGTPTVTGPPLSGA